MPHHASKNFDNRYSKSVQQEVESKLHNLAGLSQADFRQAINAANMSRNDETTNSTKSYAGVSFYHNLIKALRDILAPKGFEAYSYRGVEMVVHKQLAIVVCKGDESTGNINQSPFSAHKKGSMTLELFGLVQNDHPDQKTLFDKTSALKINQGKLQLELDGKQRDIWIVMHYSEKLATGDYHVAAELSQPSTYDSQGYINSFNERIILNLDESEPIGGTPSTFTDNIDFDIE